MKGKKPMCSILGCFSPKKVRSLDFEGRQLLNRLIKINLYRGGDGAGLWTQKGGLQKSLKLNLPVELAKRKGEKDFLLHLRRSTNGDVVDRLCHPFVLDDIAYCHNGHISNWYNFGVEMDSLAGLFAIAKGKKAIEELEGWYVFAWYDMKQKTINLLNHNGGIQYGWHRGNLIFASEGLDKVLKKYYVIPDNKWYVFRAYQSRVKVKEIKVIKPKETHIFSLDKDFGYIEDNYYNEERIRTQVKNYEKKFITKGI